MMTILILFNALSTNCTSYPILRLWASLSKKSEIHEHTYSDITTAQIEDPNRTYFHVYKSRL